MVHWIQRIYSGTLTRNESHQEESTKVQAGRIAHPNKQVLNRKLLSSENSEDSPVLFPAAKGNVSPHSRCYQKSE